MIADAGVAAVRPSTLYLILKEAGLIGRWKQPTSGAHKKGFVRPDGLEVNRSGRHQFGDQRLRQQAPHLLQHPGRATDEPVVGVMRAASFRIGLLINANDRPSPSANHPSSQKRLEDIPPWKRKSLPQHPETIHPAALPILITAHHREPDRLEQRASTRDRSQAMPTVQAFSSCSCSW
jgi:hypothetical protein